MVEVIVGTIGSGVGPLFVSIGGVFETMVEMVGSGVEHLCVSSGEGAFERIVKIGSYCKVRV